MKNVVFVTLVLSFLLSGCATNLTAEGQKVRIVTENQKENNCEFLKFISVRVGLGPDKPGSALKKAMNEAGSIGANGFYLISDTVHWAEGASVTGEALKCKGLK